MCCLSDCNCQCTITNVHGSLIRLSSESSRQMLSAQNTSHRRDSPLFVHPMHVNAKLEEEEEEEADQRDPSTLFSYQSKRWEDLDLHSYCTVSRCVLRFIFPHHSVFLLILRCLCKHAQIKHDLDPLLQSTIVNALSIMSEFDPHQYPSISPRDDSRPSARRDTRMVLISRHSDRRNGSTSQPTYLPYSWQNDSNYRLSSEKETCSQMYHLAFHRTSIDLEINRPLGINRYSIPTQNIGLP